MSFLRIERISKSFDATPVLRNVSLEMARGEIVCLLGPSGCGKTTLLRIIAGLERPDAGRVLLSGQDITRRPSHKRDFGLMFQDYVLFPHMTVGRNIAFGLQMHGWSQARIQQRVSELLELVALPGYEARRVYELSGGEQQRVALARSLAPNPQLLMLDEPLGALDRTLRDQLLIELRNILKRLGQTAIYVTHDQVEAFSLADRVALIRTGIIEQVGTPEALYLRPRSPFAARFLGMTNILAGSLISLNPPRIDTPVGLIQPSELPDGLHKGQRVTLVIRPEAATVTDEPIPVPNHLTLTLIYRSFRGAHTLIRLQAAHGDALLEFEIPGMGRTARPGEVQHIAVNPEAIVVFPPEKIP